MAQIWTKPPPTELALVAAVTEFTINDKGDDFGATVYNDSGMMSCICLEYFGVAIPSVFRATVVENDFDCASIGGL